MKDNIEYYKKILKIIQSIDNILQRPCTVQCIEMYRNRFCNKKVREGLGLIDNISNIEKVNTLYMLLDLKMLQLKEQRS